MSLLQTWKDRLIDVSARNPLLYFRFVTAEGKPRTHFVELLDLPAGDLHKLLAGKALTLDARLRTHLDVPLKHKPERPTAGDIAPLGGETEQAILSSWRDDSPPEARLIASLEASLIAPFTGKEDPAAEVQAELEAHLRTSAAEPAISAEAPVAKASAVPAIVPPADSWLKHLEKLHGHAGEWNLAQRNRVLYNLRNKDRSAEEETGLNVLYLTWGFLKWRLRDKDDWTWSPLFLVPMDLDRQGVIEPKYQLRLDEDETLVFNPTLRLFLQQSFALDLSGIPEKFDEETPTPELLAQGFAKLEGLIQDRPGWEVVRHRPVLAIFHFANLILYREMEAWGEEMAAHPLISRFISPELLQQADFRDARDIDRQQAPQQSFQVIDADSSQQEAIQAARDGISFVLDGPPGTGKSQTIVNIIAELVAQGKKVLFVSQKKAALEVVHYRMGQIGLAHLCLDLHDHRQSNKAFIEALASAQLALEAPLPEAPAEGLFSRLGQVRQQLNAYCDALHSRPGKLGYTVHELYAACSQSLSAPELAFGFAEPLAVDEHRLADIYEALHSLARQIAVHQQAETHPWRGFKSEQALTLGERETFLKSFGKLQSTLQELQGLSKTWAELTGAPISESLIQLQGQAGLRRQLVQIPSLPAAWCNGETDAHLQALYAERDAHKAAQVAWEELLLFAREEVSVRELELLSEGAEKFRKLGPLRLLLPGFYAWKKKLAEVFYQNGAAQSDPARVAKDIESYRQQLKDRQELLNRPRDFASRYQGFETDWSGLEAELDWLRHLLAVQPMNPALGYLLRQMETQAEFSQIQARLQSLLQAAEAEQSLLEQHWSPGGLPEGWSAQIEALGAQAAEIGRLDEWTAYVRLRHELQKLGLGDFLTRSRQQDIAAEQLKDVFTQRFFRLYLDSAEAQLPVLREFDSDEHRRRVGVFAGLDRDQLPLNRSRVLYQHQRAYQRAQSVIPSAQLSTLRKLAAQKRPRKRIRWIVKSMRELMLQVYPCWMMSPLSVAQFIELEKGKPTTVFDTVIFDEASQIYPEDGLSSIFRGSQLIVAGDPLQMPPTSVARAFMELEESDDDVSADYESVLDLAATILRRRRLMWHYRSRFEELINPSNYHIYDGDLITFPRAELPADQPVEFRYVAEGVFEKRRNLPEAEALVKELVELHHRHSGPTPLSVGIIAMGIGQQECIREVIQAHQAQDPSLEALFDEDRSEEALFIKNLENVQGDERDVILISVGYGKNKEGKFFQRFGPINQNVGHRRLNVAFTRARHKILVFCSFHSHEVKVKPNARAGIRFLRDYLRFAETGHLEAPRIEATTKAHTGIEEQLLDALQARGLDIVPRLGSSRYRLDLAVRDPRDPHHYVLGIESDGAMYAAAQTARERDRLRQDLLTQAGWQLERVWSRDWAKAPSRIVDALCARIETLAAEHEETLKQRREEAEALHRMLEQALAEAVLIVSVQGRYTIQKDGALLYPPFFDRCDEEPFGEGLYRIWSWRKVGLLQADGRLLIEPNLDAISSEPLGNGHYVIEAGGKIGLMNAYGQILLQPTMDSLDFDFSPGFALSETAGKYGILSQATGHVLVAPEFDWVSEWQGDHANLGLGDKLYRLGTDGQLHEHRPMPAQPAAAELSEPENP